jgi:hypothetical protein
MYGINGNNECASVSPWLRVRNDLTRSHGDTARLLAGVNGDRYKGALT